MILLLLYSLCAQAGTWQEIFSSPKIHWGVQIPSPEPYQLNQNENFLPASTAKIITAAAALHTLGKDFRFETKIQFSQTQDTASNLTVFSDGDPTVAMEEFDETIFTRTDKIADELLQRGIKRIVGSIQFRSSDPRWDIPHFPQGWKDNDKLSCYGALPFGFNLDINCGAFQVISAKKGKWLNPGLNEKVILELREGEKTRLENCGAPGQLKICGTWGGKAQTVVFPVQDTKNWMKNLLLQSLRKKGIETNEESAASAGELMEFSIFSVPLTEMLKPFLKNSIGIIGESLFKKMGTLYRSENLYEGGKEAVFSYMYSTTLPLQNFDCYDGSGLSRNNKTTPNFSMDFLAFLPRENFFPAIWDALSIAGVDGTLRGRMKKTAAEGVLRGKTGTLDGVYNLVGYIQSDQEYIPFVILTATTTGQQSRAKHAMDLAGVKLAEAIARGNDPSTQNNSKFVPAHSTEEIQLLKESSAH